MRTRRSKRLARIEERQQEDLRDENFFSSRMGRRKKKPLLSKEDRIEDKNDLFDDEDFSQKKDPTKRFIEFETKKDERDFYEGEDLNYRDDYNEKELEVMENNFTRKVRKRTATSRQARKKTRKEVLMEKFFTDPKSGIRYTIDHLPKVMKKKKWSQKARNDPKEYINELMWEYEKILRVLMPNRSFRDAIDVVEGFNGKNIVRDKYMPEIMETRCNGEWIEKPIFISDDEINDDEKMSGDDIDDDEMDINKPDDGELVDDSPGERRILKRKVKAKKKEKDEEDWDDVLKDIDEKEDF